MVRLGLVFQDGPAPSGPFCLGLTKLLLDLGFGLKKRGFETEVVVVDSGEAYVATSEGKTVRIQKSEVSPLRVKVPWTEEASLNLEVPFYVVVQGDLDSAAGFLDFFETDPVNLWINDEPYLGFEVGIDEGLETIQNPDLEYAGPKDLYAIEEGELVQYLRARNYRGEVLGDVWS